MSDTNDMRRDFEEWFMIFYGRLPVRNGNSYEIESLGRWTAWQAASERATASQWQPIETAPLDGTVILLWGVWTGLMSGKNDKPSMDNGYYFGDDMDPYLTWAGTGRDIYSTSCYATHWMPLPMPPVVQQGGAK